MGGGRGTSQDVRANSIRTVAVEMAIQKINPPNAEFWEALNVTVQLTGFSPWLRLQEEVIGVAIATTEIATGVPGQALIVN